ncbi:hypothetical protein [Nocardia alba]|uniref:Uncharacterized protein n=1 Tax=Nocardia alba TaxID=225051 RepID=A0A4R1FGM7_9NOCA|nr:hypothetical protein [Nocardia alba]TCJ90001.1 hypothetical protein DFR71_6294 [Nocardia alba]
MDRADNWKGVTIRTRILRRAGALCVSASVGLGIGVFGMGTAAAWPWPANVACGYDNFHVGNTYYTHDHVQDPGNVQWYRVTTDNYFPWGHAMDKTNVWGSNNWTSCPFPQG